MRFHSALISSFFSAFAVVAHYQIDGGALLTGADNRAFRTVSTAVNVPQLSGNVGDGISVLATLQSTDCPTSVSIGFNCAIETSFKTSCVAWVHVVPGNPEFFTDFPINVGDTVVFGVTSPYHRENNPADDHGIRAFIENGPFRTQNFTDTACGSKAGWGVSNTPNDGSFNGIAHFGKLVFTTARAFTPGGNFHGPADQMAQDWNMTDRDGHLIATVSAGGESMVITDVRG